MSTSSDEVAEDYKASLEYLTANDRYAINNLTVIAKENTEHADAICKVLEERIKTAPPNHKLPALYVLDSIAKNIGTPYTLFLGHNLYRTFMGAYSLVDHHVRKKLDEMLRTWKNPVPGSIDSRPVFPAETTRSIENALIQARTMAVRQQQQQHQNQLDLLRRKAVATTPGTNSRNTPTPPQTVARYPAPMSQSYIPNPLNGNYQTTSPYPSYAQYAPPLPTPLQYHQSAQSPTPYNNVAAQLPDLESLQRDIEILIITTKDQFVHNPYDETIQTRLKALLDLQTVLRTQHIPPPMLQAVRDQINQLQNAPLPSLPSTPQVLPIAPAPLLAHISHQPPPSVPAMPSAASLSDLLASVARSKQAPTPPIHPTIPQTRLQEPGSQPQNSSTAPVGTENPLIASLRAAGMIPPAGSTPVNGTIEPPRVPLSYMPHQPAINAPPIQLSNLVKSVESDFGNTVELTSTSVKRPRPNLISKLYEARPNQCSICARRFLLTEEGRTRKARHLDWHFRTNLRLADSAKRGQSRSWYVDELEWIKSREIEEGIDGLPNGLRDSKALAAAAAVKSDPKTKFISVPSDSALASLPCPICQEKFDTSWSDQVQDFVWMDAEKIGAKIYHASCYSELQKDGANTPRTSTPDSVLGKRKAETSSNNPSPSKVKKESPM